VCSMGVPGALLSCAYSPKQSVASQSKLEAVQGRAKARLHRAGQGKLWALGRARRRPPLREVDGADVVAPRGRRAAAALAVLARGLARVLGGWGRARAVSTGRARLRVPAKPRRGRARHHG
jgi:hypothetical protein